MENILIPMNQIWVLTTFIFATLASIFATAFQIWVWFKSTESLLNGWGSRYDVALLVPFSWLPIGAWRIAKVIPSALRRKP